MSAKAGEVEKGEGGQCEGLQGTRKEDRSLVVCIIGWVVVIGSYRMLVLPQAVSAVVCMVMSIVSACNAIKNQVSQRWSNRTETRVMKEDAGQGIIASGMYHRSEPSR